MCIRDSSYGEDEIGSSMTTNYICIRKDMTIRQAMSELVKQAGENDNISTLYVVDENDKFYGAIDLKDLIIARAEDSLSLIHILRDNCYNALCRCTFGSVNHQEKFH